MRPNKRSTKNVVFLFVLLSEVVMAQQNRWAEVTLDLLQAKRAVALLPAAKKHSIERKIVLVAQRDGWECTGKEEVDELLHGLKYEWVPLKTDAKTVMVTSGQGCARGGQGANGAMWLFDVSDKTPVYLGELGGWGPGILGTNSDGYHDVVTGWHMSAVETGLAYYRFDGKAYRHIDGADAISDDDGNWKITPSKPSEKKQQISEHQ
ncbi:MAG TPA: hypothetical protein VF214_02370 [Edaphobacter sp.]